ncbi:MAG: ABC transporter ATP-binding protein [Theionarchaea archaeon]|nr:ABC transporter ATP-binding protein [Theionarchaea archaeon]
MEKVIEVEELLKRYKNVVAVNGISFDVYRGEIFSLVGPNAAGKTTTVEILECLRTPTSGSATVLGFDVTTNEDAIKRRIGVMPQDFNTFERLTVTENVELIARIYNVKPDIEQVLRELGVWEVRDRRFEALSGGMKRRVGISMALVSDPELLFLDEPTTGLDPQARRETWEVIRRLKKMGKTVVLTSHYMEEVEALSDRAAVIVQGTIIAKDTVDVLISQYGGGFKVNVANGDKRIEELFTQLAETVISHEKGVTGTFQTRQEASKALASVYQLGDQYTVDITEPSMDDVFSQLAGGRVDERGELV